jgi:DNA-binding NarL/FixJ family response regulator
LLGYASIRIKREVASPEAGRTSDVSDQAGSHRLRVVIVDDRREVRAPLRELLTRETSAIVVAEAEDGEDAAQAAAESQAELVIMGYQMPHVDSVEATRRVKAASPSTRVVAFSSAAEHAVASAFEAAGASAYFDKTQIDELVAHIRSLSVRQ